MRNIVSMPRDSAGLGAFSLSRLPSGPFVTKLDSSGLVQWASSVQEVGGSSISIAADSSGRSYIAGASSICKLPSDYLQSGHTSIES